MSLAADRRDARRREDSKNRIRPMWNNRRGNRTVWWTLGVLDPGFVEVVKPIDGHDDGRQQIH